MTDRTPSEPGDPPDQLELMRELTRRWVTSQAVISAYVTAHVSDLHHAEDLVQDVAQAVAEKFHEFDRNRSFTGWALGIARNRILKYYRSQSRDRLVLSETALEGLAEAFSNLEPEAEGRREALRNCLSKVDGRRRHAIELRYRDNLKVADIAHQFDTSPSAISVMLHRARKALLECVKHRLVSET